MALEQVQEVLALKIKFGIEKRNNGTEKSSNETQNTSITIILSIDLFCILMCV